MSALVLISRSVCPFDRGKEKPCHICTLGIPRLRRGYDACPVYLYRAAAQRLDPKHVDSLDDITKAP
jgi:hypothetical protein